MGGHKTSKKKKKKKKKKEKKKKKRVFHNLPIFRKVKVTLFQISGILHNIISSLPIRHLDFVVKQKSFPFCRLENQNK